MWWVALALAGPVRIHSLPFAAHPVPWPPGIETTLVQFPVPTGADTVSFALEGPPVVVGEELVLRGFVENPTNRPLTFYLVDAPHTGGPFALGLTGEGVTWVPRPVDPGSGPPANEVFPMARRVTLPARARVVYETGLALPQFRHPRGARATLSWTFALAPNPASGAVPVTLP